MGVMVLGHSGCRIRWDKVRGAFVEVTKPHLPCRGASSPSWAGNVSILLLSVLWPWGGCREGLAAALGRALHVQPPVPPVSPSATICLPCASISCCYGNGGFQGNG